MYMPQIDQVILLQPVVILLVLFDFNYQYGFTACSFLLLIFLPIYDCVSSDTFWKGGERIVNSLCPAASHFSDFAVCHLLTLF